jgi:hypothetical protein
MGVGILTSGYYSPGTLIQIHVPPGSFEAARVLPAEVRHAISQAGGAWLIGCVFHRLMGVADLSAFG